MTGSTDVSEGSGSPVRSTGGGRRGLWLVLAVVAVGTALAIGGQWARQQLAIDACLDRGGRFDRETSRCETAEEARLLDVFSLRHDGVEDVGEHLPIGPGTRWTYRHERRERVGEDTLTASWVREVRVTDQRRRADGLLVLRDGSISNLRARGSPGVDQVAVERWRHEIAARAPRHLFVRDGYVWEIPRDSVDDLRRESGLLADRVPVLFFPLRVGVIWSDRERERADLEAARRFARGGGPAPEPYEGYWTVETRRDTTIAPGRTTAIYRLGYRSASGHASLTFVDGVGVVAELRVRFDRPVRETARLLDLSRP